MKKLVLLFYAATFFASPMCAEAEGLWNVTIQKVGINRSAGNFVFIKTSADPSAQQRIACHTNNDWNFVLPLETVVDKSIYAQLLAAYGSQSTVGIEGAGDCGSSGIETLGNFFIYK